MEGRNTMEDRKAGNREVSDRKAQTEGTEKAMLMENRSGDLQAWMAGISKEEAEAVQREVKRQMRIIKQGAVELVGEEDLERKLACSMITGRPLTVKFGMDPSAPDIHLGHSVILRKLRQLQKLGHTIVIVIGDFTARIGDPTGKSKGRRAMTDKEVLCNAQTYQEQIFHILDRDATQVRYNGEWLELLGLSRVLELASAITVARLLERDDFKRRFQGNIPIGLHEFFYPLMQAYDSVALQADIELGGTDQTFNVLMGRSLQRDQGQESQAALFMPILEGTDGVEKMSKSLGNYIGIDEDAATMFTKVMQVPDRLMIKYFELATDILPEELDQVKARLAEGCNPRDVKLQLARDVTALYHQEEEVEAAEKFFREAFQQKTVPEQVEILPVVWKQGNLFDCMGPLIERKLVASGSEFRRLLSQGGVQKNGVRVGDLEETIQDGDVLRVGKRRFVRLELL